MGWNKKVSLITFIIVLVLVIILYRRNEGSDRHIAIFSLVFVSIQLLEYFAWSSLEKNDKRLNDLITRLILVFLWMQPLVNSYMAHRNNKSPILLLFIVVFSIMFIASSVTASEGEFETTEGENHHLVWKRNGMTGQDFLADFKTGAWMYWAGLLIPLLFIKPLKKGIILAVTGAVLFFIAKSFSSKDETSSSWCWIAGVFTLVALIFSNKTMEIFNPKKHRRYTRGAQKGILPKTRGLV